MTAKHGMWLPADKADTRNVACMSGCEKSVIISSQLPDFARSAHGDIQKQNREWGAIRGQDTSDGKASAEPAPAVNGDVRALLNKHTCMACHQDNINW
jgi:hypothetical protein